MPSPPATAHQGTTDLRTSVATELPRVAGGRGVYVRCSSAQSYPVYEYWRFDNAHVHFALPPIASPSSPNFVGSRPRTCKACQLTTAPYSRTFSPTIWGSKKGSIPGLIALRAFLARDAAAMVEANQHTSVLGIMQQGLVPSKANGGWASSSCRASCCISLCACASSDWLCWTD